jgi:hypothetical protein
MVSKLSLALAILLVVAAHQHTACGLEASQPSPAASVMYATQNDVDAIKSDVQALRRDIAALTKAISAVAKVDAPADSAATPAADNFDARLEAIEEAQAKLLRIMESQGATLGQIAARDERGQYYPQFYGNSEQSRESMSRAIKSTVPRRGQLVVTNNTPVKRRITVNEDVYIIRPGEPRTIDVPPGNFSTQYENEQQKFWHLGPANEYTQRLFLIVDR